MSERLYVHYARIAMFPACINAPGEGKATFSVSCKQYNRSRTHVSSHFWIYSVRCLYSYHEMSSFFRRCSVLPVEHYPILSSIREYTVLQVAFYCVCTYNVFLLYY